MNADGIVDVSGYYAYPAPTWALTLRDEADRLSTDYTVTSSTITRTKNYFHFGNLLVSTRDAGGAYAYYGSDHLGTPRLVTGALSETHTYHPFGQEITPLFGNQPLKFAAMERDTSSGNDSDHARVCATSTLGRFLSPDKLQGKIPDPQSWNRYSYARSNPVKYFDPNGLEVIYGDRSRPDKTLQLGVRILERDPRVRQLIAFHTGPGAPDLLLRRGDAGRDRSGSKARGVTKPNIDFSYKRPDGSYNVSDPSGADQLPCTGRCLTGAAYKGATVTIDTGVAPSVSPGTATEFLSVLAHELGHVQTAAYTPTEYLYFGADEFETDLNNDTSIEHDLRPLERMADEFRRAVFGSLSLVPRR